MIVVNSRFLTQQITGVQRFAVELCKRLKSLNSDVVFVAPKAIVLNDEAEYLEVKIVGNHVGHLWEQYDLPRWLRKHGSPLLLNLANTAPMFYKNKIVTIHDVAFKFCPQSYSKKFLLAYDFIIPRIIKSSKLILTVSNFSKSEIVKYYSVQQSKVDVIYNSVDASFISEGEVAEPNYFLAVSSLNYRKNFIYVLKAFNKFSASNKEFKLYIVGDLKSDSFGEIDLSQYKSNPNILFLGRVSDEELKSLYKKAFGFIYPSLYEGFGIPPLEAQATGCPVICSNVSSLPEVFEKSVLYCDPYKEETLVDCMVKLEDREVRSQLVSKGRDNLNRFSWENSAEKLNSILIHNS